jgi:hypothetical protein
MEFWILLGCAIVVAIVIKTLPTPEERGNAGRDTQAEQAPPARNGRTVVRSDLPDHSRHSIRRKMMLRVGILALIGLIGGVETLLWCRRSGATDCNGEGGILAFGVLALIGTFLWFRQRP